ncbi:unnamed protein product [Lactuca saligna]|uniref:Mitotic checkpoint protein BUB3 n=1 Tax=Lactuca saligna TaxID=75948 RepID=A0AA35Z2Y4_LACSI|nr:unnamed protein product [Lactuca saligna]
METGKGGVASLWRGRQRETRSPFKNKDHNLLRGEFLHGGAVLDCCFHDYTSGFSASADNTVTRLVFDHEKEDLLGRHDAPVRCIEYSYATGKVITGSWDETLKCWDPRGGGAQERAMDFFDAMAPIIFCLQTCSISCFWMGEDYDDEKPLSSKYNSKSKVGSSNNHKPVVPKVHQNGSASKDNNQLRNIGLNKRPPDEERSASVKKPKLSDFVTPINHKPVATMFSVMFDTDYMAKPQFKDNF